MTSIRILEAQWPTIWAVDEYRRELWKDAPPYLPEDKVLVLPTKEEK